MSRAPGQSPQFGRIIRNIERAEKLWAEGNHQTAERLLKLAASIAIDQSSERGPNDPVPE